MEEQWKKEGQQQHMKEGYEKREEGWAKKSEWSVNEMGMYKKAL